MLLFEVPFEIKEDDGELRVYTNKCPASADQVLEQADWQLDLMLTKSAGKYTLLILEDTSELAWLLRQLNRAGEYPCCKHCGRPIEAGIEGELVCGSCYSAHEDPVPAEEAAAIRHYFSHCDECDRPLPGGGTCPTCKAEQDRILAELAAMEEADWGDGSMSPEAELRKVALDHRGQP